MWLCQDIIANSLKNSTDTTLSLKNLHKKSAKKAKKHERMCKNMHKECNNTTKLCKNHQNCAKNWVWTQKIRTAGKKYPWRRQLRHPIFAYLCQDIACNKLLPISGNLAYYGCLYLALCLWLVFIRFTENPNQIGCDVEKVEKPFISVYCPHHNSSVHVR